MRRPFLQRVPGICEGMKSNVCCFSSVPNESEDARCEAPAELGRGGTQW